MQNLNFDPHIFEMVVGNLDSIKPGLTHKIIIAPLEAFKAGANDPDAVILTINSLQACLFSEATSKQPARNLRQASTDMPYAKSSPQW